jgi:ubiquinone/menaquinone biosynthesis C-methylase UbiE
LWRPTGYSYSEHAAVFDQRAQEYDRWFDEHELIYRAEVSAVREFLSREGIGIEVGAGTGRFSQEGAFVVPRAERL